MSQNITTPAEAKELIARAFNIPAGDTQLATDIYVEMVEDLVAESTNPQRVLDTFLNGSKAFTPTDTADVRAWLKGRTLIGQ